MMILETASSGGGENRKVSARNSNWLVMPSEAQGLERRHGAGKGAACSSDGSRSAERDLESPPTICAAALAAFGLAALALASDGEARSVGATALAGRKASLAA